MTTQPTQPTQLTPRELELLARLALGDTIPEAAAATFMSPATAKAHTLRIRDRLQARNTTHAVAIAIRTGLLGPTA